MTLILSNQNRKMRKLADMLGLPKKSVIAVDLPAGYTCPMANICKSYAHRKTGKLRDGKNCKVRCYSASTEAAFPSVRKARWHNLEQLFGKSTDEMTEVILSSLPNWIKVVRIHSGGDFFNDDYFQAWVKVAQLRPEISFFGYTKVLDYINADKPDNFHLVYSMGGKMDNLVTNEPTCTIVRNIEEANNLGIKIACENHPADDYNFILQGKTFALLIHGTQPARKR